MATSIKFTINGTCTEKMRISVTGIGISITKPNLPELTIKADTASIRIKTGVLATTPVSGNFESDGKYLYWTDSLNVRHQLDF